VSVTRARMAFAMNAPALRSAGAAGDVGGAALLTGEAAGFGVDFTYDTDATKRVAVKVSNVVTEYAVDSFFGNAGTSPKQVYNVAGALVWSPHNMCLQSQTFEQATPWNPTTALTVTANAIAAPDGTLTADRLVETATTTNHQILHSNITWVTGETYTISVYAKAGERNWLAITPANTATIADWFDLTNGVVGTTANGGVMTSVGSGWYRCSITFVKDATTGGPTIFVRTANGQTGTYLGDITKGLYVWGAQLNRGSAPTAYIPTTTAARFGLALDYDPSTHAAKGLRCEPAATNLLLNNATLSTQSVTVTAVAHTLSFWGTGTITLSGVSTAGPLVGTGAANRVSLNFTPTAGSLTLTVTGTVSAAQLETGSVATSPIPTFAASATRAVDRYNCTPASINYSATAGGWWGEFTPLSSLTGSRLVGFANGGCTPMFYNTNLFQQYDSVGTLDKAVTWAYGATHKMASAYASGSRAVTGNGAAVTADAGPTANLLNPGASVNFGNDGTTPTSPMNGYIRKVFYVPRRMTNAELATKTT